MILLFILLGLYAVLHARGTIKGMRIKEDTVESANATTRLVIFAVGTIVLLGLLAGGI